MDDIDLLSPGKVIDGAWTIVRLIGRGGMGVVYEVAAPSGARAALKMLGSQHLHDSMVRSRFSSEARIANSIPHPGVVRVLGDGAYGRAPYFVMELVQGRSLREIWNASQRRLDVHTVTRYLIPLLDVLDAAHHAGVVHRDIKPDNVLVTDDGTVRLVDFGIARAFANESSVATSTGTTLGTPAFMAPEQALSRWHLVDARSDLYSAGATAYFLLSGTYLHDASNQAEHLVAAATRPARPIRDVLPSLPEPLAQVIDRSVAFDREQRFPDAASFKRAWLEALAAPPPRRSGRGILFALTAALALGAVAAGGLWWLSLSSGRASVQEDEDDAKPKKKKKRPRPAPSATSSGLDERGPAPTAPPAPSTPVPTSPCSVDFDALARELDRALGGDARLYKLDMMESRSVVAAVETKSPKIGVVYLYNVSPPRLDRLQATKYDEFYSDAVRVDELKPDGLRKACAGALREYRTEVGDPSARPSSQVEVDGLTDKDIEVSLSSPALAASYCFDLKGKAKPCR